jgi:hypothetical protein
MFCELGMIVFIERPMSVAKLLNGFYSSNSLQQNSSKDLESGVRMIVKHGQIRTITRELLRCQGLIFRWRLYDQYFSISMRGRGLRQGG